MKRIIFLVLGSSFVLGVFGADAEVEGIRRDLDSLKKRVAALEEENVKLSASS